jgi:hypothetical protein
MALEGRALLSTFTVSSTADDGSAHTLRSAIDQANEGNQADTIVFSGLFDAPQTITLTLGPLTLTNSATTTITGPGANLLSVSGAGKSRVFDVEAATAAISGLTITGGENSIGAGVRNSAGTLNLTDCTITGNTAGQGGALYAYKGMTTLTGCTISGNTAGFGGGGLKTFLGTLVLSACTITGNTASYGGGLFSDAGTTTLTGCTISGNSAVSSAVTPPGPRGGGMSVVGGTVTLTGCSVSGNSARLGGGFYVWDGRLSLSDANVFSDSATTGGGLYASGASTPTLTNVTLWGNSAAENGGGLYLNGGSTATLTNITITGNSAGGGGGGLYLTGGNSNFGPSSASLVNTILAGQTAGGDRSGAGTISGTNNLLGVNPMLSPLGDYGGPIPTMALLPGSPAIGSGALGAGIPTTDERGLPLDSPNPDIGAFQTTPLVVNTTIDGTGSPSGELSLRQAVNLANARGGTEAITFDPAVFAAAQTITLTGGQLELRASSGTETINGPGANLLTVSGVGKGRVFDLASGTAALSGLTVTGGRAYLGGGVYNDGGTLALTYCTISGNSAGSGGGLCNHYGTLGLTDCIVSHNIAYGYRGGGLDNEGGTLTLTDCTVSGNSCSEDGGGVAAHCLYTIEPESTVVADCTVTGNSAGEGGGLFLFSQIGTLTLTNCTVSGNDAGTGGGLYNTLGTATLTNTIVAGNSHGDFQGNYMGGHDMIGGDPLLAPLDDYGGPSATMALLPGSPAIGGGESGAGIPTTDQRGLPLDSPNPDIGAFQSQGFTLTPVAESTPQAAGLGGAFAQPLTVTVTARDPAEPVDGGVIRFTVDRSAGGAAAALSAGSAAIADGRAGVTATASAIGGSYTITASAAAAQASFTLTNSSSLLVTTTKDDSYSSDGSNSLREAVEYAVSHPGASTITFDPAVFGTAPQTITLILGPLVLANPTTTTILGPGTNLLTVSGGNVRQVFGVEDGSAALLGLSVTGGRGNDGGGLYNDGGTLALFDCAVSGNIATDGGGLFTQSGGATTLTNCTVTGNGANDGGGLFTQSGGTTALSNCTVSGNGANDGGGLFTQSGGTTALSNCTVSGNTAGGNGGGLYNSNPFSAASTTTLTNCTLSGNRAGANGGGLYNDSQGNLMLTNCTVSGNTAGATGGGLYLSPGSQAIMTNTIVAAAIGGGDVQGALNPRSANNLVGIGTGLTGISTGSQGNQVGTAQAPINPLLAPLGDYGGPTQTMALLPGSSAIGCGGSGFGIPTTDQRGLSRDGHVDIGAFESQGFIINTVSGSTPQSIQVGKPFKNPLAVTVTANNPVEPVNGGVVSFVANPGGGAFAVLSSATATIAGGGAAVNATANGTPGTYSVTASAMGAGTTSFALSNSYVRGVKGTPSPIVVNVTNGVTGLRDAIAYANRHPGPDTIILDLPVFGAKRWTIRLTGSPLVLTDLATTTIIGPGAELLTLSGGGKSRVFDIEGGSLDLSGVTIAHGKADRGGGLRNERGRLVLTNVLIHGNRAIVGGGLFNDGRTTLRAVLIKGNRAHVGPGLFNTRGASFFGDGRRRPAAEQPGLTSPRGRNQRESQRSGTSATAPISGTPMNTLRSTRSGWRALSAPPNAFT